MRITRAMILAAGLGTRMRPLTETTPKPLVKVGGMPLIDHAMRPLRAHGVKRVVVNMHWLAGQIADWARRQSPPPSIILSDERDMLLETGGGLNKALPLLAAGEGEAPFFVLNSDSFWLESGAPALKRLEQAWDDAAMDCLVLTCPLERAVGYSGGGDFIIGEGGLVRRAPGQPGAQVFTGVYVVHPRLFADAPRGPFSMNLLFDRAMAAARMYGISHDGPWLHVGTPQAIGEAEKAMRKHRR